jgi:hypothetical protein
VTAWKGIVGKGFTADEFSEYVSGIQFEKWIPDMVVLHNTQEPTLAEWHSVPGERRMQGLASFYRDEQKWSGGPHLFVAPDLVWVFTPLTVPGVHSPSWNQVSWGVETVGDFDHETLSAPHLDNLIGALLALHRLAGFAVPTVRLHKEDPKTEHTYCPGKNLDKAVVLNRLTLALS